MIELVDIRNGTSPHKNVVPINALSMSITHCD